MPGELRLAVSGLAVDDGVLGDDKRRCLPTGCTVAAVRMSNLLEFPGSVVIAEAEPPCRAGDRDTVRWLTCPPDSGATAPTLPLPVTDRARCAMAAAKSASTRCAAAICLAVVLPRSC